MAWLVFDLDDTLVTHAPDEEGNMTSTPIPGAVEAVTRYANEGHRVTVFTSRFAPMPDSARFRLKQQIEQELAQFGFPPVEVWSGTTKPDADIFFDDKAVTFDGDWNLAQAQADYMIMERGLSQSQGEPGQEEG